MVKSTSTLNESRSKSPSVSQYLLGREGKGREGKGKEGKGRERKGKERKRNQHMKEKVKVL